MSFTGSASASAILNSLNTLSFENPAALPFAALAILPLALHLLNRRKVRRIPFSALDFLLRSERKNRRRLKLRSIVLLILRTALLLLIPLAVARPCFSGDAGTGKNSGTDSRAAVPIPTILLVDTSLSMRARDSGGETSFQRALKRSEIFLERLPADDPLAVFACDPKAVSVKKPAADRAAAFQQLKSLSPGWHDQALNRCIGQAAEVLSSLGSPKTRLVIASDFAQGSLRLSEAPPALAAVPGLETILLSAATALQKNFSVDSLRITKIDEGGAGEWRFDSTLTNHSSGNSEQASITVNLRVNGSIAAKGFSSVSGGGKANISFSHRFQTPGTYVGSVEIGDPDGLSEDNVFYFTLRVPARSEVLLVNGSPSDSRFRDEAYFIQTALADRSSPAKAVLADSLKPHLDELQKFRAVFLLNIGQLGEDGTSALKQFVRGGGGLFVSLGDQIDPDVFNHDFAGLSPRSLRLIKSTGLTAGNPLGSAARLTKIDSTHPALGVFSREGAESLLSARFQKYFLTERAAPGESGGDVLAEYDDGAPALLTHKFGNGRTVLFTSSIDRGWNDLPVRPGFLPLIHRLTGWITGMMDDTPEGKTWFSGQIPLLDMPEAESAEAVEIPDGTTVPLILTQDRSAKVFGEAALPGIYRVKSHSNPERDSREPRKESLDFAINHIHGESDLHPLDNTALRAWFGNNRTHQLSFGGRAGSGDGIPIPTILLSLAAVCLFLEGILSRRR